MDGSPNSLVHIFLFESAQKNILLLEKVSLPCISLVRGGYTEWLKQTVDTYLFLFQYMVATRSGATGIRAPEVVGVAHESDLVPAQNRSPVELA